MYQAEQFLKKLGLVIVRVRVHGEIARIETLQEDFTVITNNSEAINVEFKKLGFKFVTMDLNGYRKGSMN